MLKKLIKTLLISWLLCGVSALLPLGFNLEIEYFSYLNGLLFVFYPLMMHGNAPSYFKQRVQSAALIFILVVINTYILYLLSNCQCNAGAFKFWFASLSLASFILVCSMSEFYRSLSLSWSRILSLHTCVIVGLGIYYVFLIWYFPQKYSMNIITGFWHGPIYDRLIEVDNNLIYSRILHTAFGLVLLLFAHFKSIKITRTTVFLVIFCSFIIIESESNRIGHHLLKDEFPVTLAGKCVKLYTTQKKALPYHLELLKQADFHCIDLKNSLELNFDQKISVFAYQTYAQKKRIFGAAETDVCDIKNAGIHINEESLPHSSLRHELAHAILSKDGFYGLGFHPNMSFTEGIATALAPGFASRSLHELAASAVNTLGMQQPQDFFGKHFWTYSGRSSYTIAGSFWRYLLEQGEQKAVLAMYSGSDPHWKNMRNLKDYQTKWFKFIKGLDTSKSSIYAKKLFDQPSPFHSQCIHSKVILKDKKDNPFHYLRQPTNWDLSSYPKWEDQFAKNPRDLQRRKALRKTAANVEDLLPLQSTDFKTIDDIVYSLDIVDTFIKQNKMQTARTILENIYQKTSDLFIGHALKRKIIARFYIMSLYPAAQKQVWLSYLATGQNLPKPTEPGWMSTYLTLRSRAGFQWFQKNRATALKPPAPILPLPKNFYFEYNMMIAKHFARSLEVDHQRSYLNKAKDFTSGERKQRIILHLRYLESSLLENSNGGQKIPERNRGPLR